MKNLSTFPAPLRQKYFLTCAIGVTCLLVGIAAFIFAKDHRMLLLSMAAFAMCMVDAVSCHRIMTEHTYEVVEGTCVAISPKPLRKYRKVRIMDDHGIESALLLNKQATIRIGYRYRFYFKDTQRLTIGNQQFNAALSSDCFLGFEEIGVFQ